tara:strand:+ start:2350 stop:3096 length:747 start_codon:yes stop_codon:yes gene_type:complete
MPELRALNKDERVVSLTDDLKDLQQRISYQFRDRGLLERALTHKSRVAEDVSGDMADNESLEFLGDSVLGLVVADMLFRQFPELSEGDKSKIKAAVVSTQALADQAGCLELGKQLLLGRGEEKTGGRFKQGLLADTYEALIAAIYLDGGLDAADNFICREFQGAIDEARRADILGSDYKSALQERVQAAGDNPPEYHVIGEDGPDHRKVFAVNVVVAGKTISHGTGRTKKEAEQEAARLALTKLVGDS